MQQHGRQAALPPTLRAVRRDARQEDELALIRAAGSGGGGVQGSEGGGGRFDRGVPAFGGRRR